MDARRRVRLGAIRPSHGDAGKGRARGRQIVDWNYELWSNTHSTCGRASQAATICSRAGILPSRRSRRRRERSRSPPAAATATRSRSTTFRASGSSNHFIKEMPLRVSALRTLGAYANVFAIESFMDELARAANADPVAFRLAHMKDPRAKAVIEAVAKKADWKAGEAGDGRRGRGIGFAKYKNLASLCRGDRGDRGRSAQAA